MAGPTTTGLATQLTGELWHYAGDTDEPAFENDWENYPGGAFPATAFRFRAPGEVDLYFAVTGGTSAVVFTLPEGYRPSSPSPAGVGMAVTLSPLSETAVGVGVLDTGEVSLDVMPTADVVVFKGSFFLDPPVVAP